MRNRHRPTAPVATASPLGGSPPTWLRVGALLVACVLLLSLASAPFGQWYIAWIALAPWLVAIAEAPTARAALLRGWLAGAAYFAVHLWWLWTATVVGTVLLTLYFSFFWALAAGLLHGLHLLSPSNRLAGMGPRLPAFDRRAGEGALVAFRVAAIAVVWVAAEWLRCYVAPGFPWLPLGSTQSPLLVMCQVADLGGPWIVSFWVVLPSALLATAWVERHHLRALRAAALMVTAILVAVAAYGAWRLGSTTTTPGPRVMVIQSNFPHLPGGAPTATREQAVDFFLTQLDARLSAERVDLVIMPEAEFPPLNDEARQMLSHSPVGGFLEETHQQLLTIARRHAAALVVGGNAVTGWISEGKQHVGTEIRNSAYLYEPYTEGAVARYDKMHLVPFSEEAPFGDGPRWLHRIALSIAASRAAQPLTAGSTSDFELFRLRWTGPSAAAGEEVPAADGRLPSQADHEARFVTPICLENVDAAVIRRMVRGPSGSRKQVDFIANLSNDGWFHWQEKYQHLQTTTFRAIEHRVPVARSSNTGISGFIDSTGRVGALVGPNTAGAAVQTMELDRRVTFYTRYGDVLAMACIALTMAGALLRGFSVMRRRSSDAR